jgi:DNA polymerase I-like protein with 3'-5' exonuclease and polymerase domains
MNISFDIETNAIYDWLNLTDVTDIKCMAISVDGEEPQSVSVGDGLTMLQNADLVIGHNIQSFDIPALQRLYPNFRVNAIFDTLIASRLLHADQRDKDFQVPGMPKEYVGSHSLGAWGHRLGQPKSVAPSFDCVSEELKRYCEQDVRVTNVLYKHLKNHAALPYAKTALDLEHNFASIVRAQERVGFPFDVAAAEILHAELRKEMLGIEQSLQIVFPPKILTRTSSKTGKPLKNKVEVFNPGSRIQIYDRLHERYNWIATEHTPDGRARVDEAVLASLEYPEAKTLSRYLTIIKRLGQLADGDEAWLKLVSKRGRIHGRVNTNGAITGRCTHSKPNMAQIPSDAAYRALFVAPKDKVLVGVDASGLELRCLAHYLGKYDNGKYARAVVEADIHWENAKAFGLIGDVAQDKNNAAHKAARNQAKGAIYALIYGAGNDKLGLVLGGNKATGSKARRNFEAKVPAYLRLKEDVEALMERRGWIKGLDGRPLCPRSAHAALNTLLQSAGAVVMKQACVIAHKKFKVGVQQVATVHDEYQFIVSPSDAEDIGKIVVQAIEQAGRDFDFRCPLTGEYRCGKNWSQTH